MKHTNASLAKPVRLTRRGQIVAAAIILSLSAGGATGGIMLQMHQEHLSKQRLERIVEQRHIEHQIQEDDGPQDGSTDCWSNCP